MTDQPLSKAAQQAADQLADLTKQGKRFEALGDNLTALNPYLGDIDALNARMIAAIERLAPKGGNTLNSAYLARKFAHPTYPQNLLKRLLPLVQALHQDYAAGYMNDFEESVKGVIFSDFLDMASHLLEETDRMPAAVVAGTTLEEHLRALCARAEVSVERDGGRPKKAATLNDELRGRDVYNLTEQKHVTAWLDIRNKAAHGERDEFEDRQVELMIQGIREFMLRNPA